MQSSAIGLMVVLILTCFLHIVPVSAGAGEVVASGGNNYGQITTWPCSDSTQLSAEYAHNPVLKDATPMDPTGVPEFPTIAVPLMLIVGFAGAVIFTRWGH